MSVILPFKNFPSTLENIVLDNIVLNIKIVWNGRDSAWIMDILDSVNSPILEGLKIVNGWELIRRYTDTRLPQGALLVVSVDSKEEVIGRNDLVDNYQIIYFTEAEVNDLI